MGDGGGGRSKKSKAFARHDDLKLKMDAVQREIESVRGALEESKRKERGPLVGIVVSGVFLVVATVGAPLAGGMVDDPAPVSCSAEKQDAYDLWKKTGIWKPVPETSPSQEQCDVNGYMEDVTGEGEGGASSDGSF